MYELQLQSKITPSSPHHHLPSLCQFLSNLVRNFIATCLPQNIFSLQNFACTHIPRWLCVKNCLKKEKKTPSQIFAFEAPNFFVLFCYSLCSEEYIQVTLILVRIYVSNNETGFWFTVSLSTRVICSRQDPRGLPAEGGRGSLSGQLRLLLLRGRDRDLCRLQVFRLRRQRQPLLHQGRMRRTLR